MEDTSEINLFNSLLTEYKNSYIRFAESYVGDVCAAEDLVMDAFMYYWENRQTIKKDNLPAYILTVVKHKCLNYLEQLKVRECYVEKVRAIAEWNLNLRISTLRACDPENLFSKEVQTIIKKVVKQMPKKTKNIFVMHCYEDESVNQIAEKMSLSGKTVEYHISKAYKSLRRALKDYYLIFLSLIYVRFLMVC